MSNNTYKLIGKSFWKEDMRHVVDRYRGEN
uniref:Uncharacterized protein n=1 Tax=Arundo donax TaxID=35708 RepID=A0A0A9A4U8_ARUDO